ncbi:MAG: hypothetical protein A2068_12040 [Ignavibacteria bacterium GWB2_35_6b]|nr:MAG: hypothetical protein A2068_12040 [Ignavibacteria bacterium GWB2_35_6b]
MKNKFYFSKKKIISILMLGFIMTFGCGGPFTETTLPADANSSCESGGQALTLAEFNTWFESGAVTLDGLVKPANSVTFPNIPNCSFYKWTEQMYLWLTSPAPRSYGGGGGLVMNSPIFYGVSLPDPITGEREFLPNTPGQLRAFNLRTAQNGALDLPVFIKKGSLRMLQILPSVIAPSGNQIIADADGNEIEIGSARLNENKQPVLLDLKGKEIKGPRALLQSKNDKSEPLFMRRLRKLEKFDRSELVQKITVDKLELFLDLAGNFHEAEQGQADGGVLMAQNGSLVYYSLAVNNVFAIYRTMQGATVPPNTSFPTTQANLNSIEAFAAANGLSPIIDSEALAIEIKASWIRSEGLAEPEKFIRAKAEVNTYDKSNPNDWVPNGTEIVELAMVGLHVVGSTAGHPELLWGTFEHFSNNPAAAYDYSRISGGNLNVPQNTTGSWIFCANGAAAPFNEMHMKMSGVNNDHIVPVAPFTISPSNIIRSFPWGLPGASANPNSEVISTNNKVQSFLDPADIRMNYFQTGTTWTIGGAAPTGGNEVGTNKLANTTMETFVQGTNCFTCHTTNTTQVSHIFDDTKPLF